MEFRNPVFNAYGTINCEVNHAAFGWIPYTASPDDPLTAEVYAAAEATAAPYVPPTEQEALDAWRATAATSKANFCTALLTAALISEGDAVDAARGLWPAAFGPATADEKIAWAAAQAVARAGTAAQAIATYLALTPEQLDALFQ